MKRVLINRLINDFKKQINNDQNYIPNDIVDASPPFTIDTATFYEFKEYVFIALKQFKSKIKTLTIVVGNSNNYTGYSTL
jgi:ACT domain-containing protein